MKENNQTEQSVLESFKSSYTEGDFKTSLKILNQNKTAFDKPLFHYNYGTVLFKMGNTAGARYHFELAKKAGLTRTELSNNLEVVKHKLQVKSIESKNPADMVNFAWVSMPSAFYTSVFLFFILLAVFFHKSTKKFLIPAIVFSLGFGIFAANKFWLGKQKLAISLSQTPVFEGPSEVFESNGSLPEGLKLVIEKQNGDWMLISSPNDYIGWVKSKDLGIL